MNPLHPLENLLDDGLTAIHTTTGLSWAWSIIALTAVVRIAIMPVTVKQTRSMMAMQRLQPYVKQLQQKYKDDRQELNKRVMEFYQTNRVNPLASCLPILLQLPVFLALFFVLKDFKPPPSTSHDFSFLFGFVPDILKNINDSGFAGWTLLVFYVLSQMFSTRVMATSADPRQKMLFMFLPIAFIPFVVNFKIGVMLYWITTNLWTLAQYLVVVRLTDKNKEVVLPEDSRGNKKVVVPKAAKADLARKQGSKGSTQNSQPVRQAPSGTARRNKRRR